MQRFGHIDRHGNKHVRVLLVEAVWRLLRWQPNWHARQKYLEKLKHGASLKKKIAVALARQLAIDVWRWAANSLGRAKGRMGEFVRRFKGRLGKAEGIVAGAHKLARIIWAMVVSGQPYDEAKAFDSTPASTARRLKNLQNQALALHMKLVPV